MDIPTRNRVELKSYFVKNSIPTEGNFADLIDGMLNQKDDGVVKLRGNPLIIEAAGDSAGTQNVINFYRNFDDASAEWSLSLNPHDTSGTTSTAQRGFSINDAGGVSRLYIDQTTGNVGLGTIHPAQRLDVTGSVIVRGAITPSVGNSETVGIMFPPDPFGGSGDRAWIRYHNARGGEQGTLEIGISNDNTDNIEMLASGRVNVRARGIVLSLERNGGGQLQIVNNPNDNSIYLEAFSTNGQSSAADFLFTGINGNNVPRITLRSDQLWTNEIYNSASGLYFWGTAHNHTGIANSEGHAAIENAANYNHLMLLGRWVSGRRYIAAWDQLTVNGTFLNNSDARAKQDVEDLDYGLREVRELRPVSFNWKRISNPQKSVGLIAQDVQQVISELVYTDPSEADEPNLSISYLGLIPVLINAIKELDAQVQRLSAG